MMKWIRARKKGLTVLLAAGLLALGIANPQQALTLSKALISIVSEDSKAPNVPSAEAPAQTESESK